LKRYLTSESLRGSFTLNSNHYATLLPVLLAHPAESGELQGVLPLDLNFSRFDFFRHFQITVLLMPFLEWVQHLSCDSVKEFNAKLRFCLNDEASFALLVARMQESNIMPDLVSTISDLIFSFFSPLPPLLPLIFL
jgi:hypothetical protein